MLSDNSRPVIQATLQPLARTSRKSPSALYRHLFTTRPELLDGTSNRGNQADGNEQQALAGAVAAFATALVNTPDRLPKNLLGRIAQKHASLRITSRPNRLSGQGPIAPLTEDQHR